MAVKAGTGIIIRKGNKILVGRRRGSHGAGRLSFPGGHIDETDPTLAFQVAREAMEETGMVVEMVPVDGRDDLFTTFDIIEGNSYLCSYIVADYVSGGNSVGPNGTYSATEPDKCDGWQFVPLDELAETVRNEEPDQDWVPIDRILHYRSILGL